jgi:hypothetical protein
MKNDDSEGEEEEEEETNSAVTRPFLALPEEITTQISVLENDIPSPNKDSHRYINDDRPMEVNDLPARNIVMAGINGSGNVETTTKEQGNEIELPKTVE